MNRTSTEKSPFRSFVFPLLIIIGVLLGLMLVLYLLTISLGQVAGEEFSPYSFSRRTFSYQQIPGVRWQFQPVVHKRRDLRIVSPMISDHLIREKPDERWDLVKDNSTASHSLSCHASILVRILEMEEEASIWSTWNRTHPEEAKVFWPRVQEAAIRNAYLLLPELVEFALSSEPENSLFSNELDRKLAEGYLRLARQQFNKNAFDLVVPLLQGAEQYGGKTPDWISLRDKLPSAMQTSAGDVDASRLVPPTREKSAQSHTDESSQ